MEDEVARLYAAPLDRFVEKRNELAKRLKAESRAEDAEAVGGLRKPSVAVWAVNQLARNRRRRERAREEAAEAKRRAQQLRRAAEEAEREALRARREADRAEKALESAERRLAALD